MNERTGKVYDTPEAVEAAAARGERLVPVSREDASALTKARYIRAQVLREAREARRLAVRKKQARRDKARSRARGRVAKASRKRNR